MFPKIDLMKLYYQSNPDGGAGNGQADPDDKNNQGDPETLETWLEKQPKELKEQFQPLFQAHVSKLQNTVKATRQERDTFQKQLTEAMKKAEKGSELETQLTGLSKSLEEANRKSDFYEQAPQFECRNPKAAFAIALTNDLFTKSGAPDWKAIQAEAPELFGKITPKGPAKKSAGSGTDEEPKGGESMNDWIRKSAGITTG